ncbi:MAG: aspartyl protease family protein [Sphingomonas sp.]|nr:aspartyl protease family protein [Sphingomonas sp.]
MRSAKLCFLMLMLVPASTVAAAAPAPTSVRAFLEGQGYHTFKLTKLPTGHETIEVTINGVSGIFVVDSGAGGTVVHRARLAKFGIEQASGEGQGAGAGGNIAITSHPVKSLLLNGQPVPLDTVRATDLDSVANRLQAATGVVIDGVVGQDVLSAYAGIINIGASELYLKLPAPGTKKPG